MSKLDDYKIFIDRFVGLGSYSRVYICRYYGDDDMIPRNQDLAIKIIDTNRLTPQFKKIIDDEIYIMNIIRNDPHPNIVECYDIIKDSVNTYIIMEYCDSGDLRDYLKKPIKEKWCQFFFCQLTNGLKYLNKYNILHRDIKPRNILLTNNKRVLKIADFGFAKQKKEKISLYDTICGSPLYMAPELMGNDKYNNQTDLWSIGMILYEMLYGFHPFGYCKNIKQLIHSVDKNEIQIPPKKTKNKNVSEECLDLLRGLLQKTTSNRITWTEFFKHPWLNVYKPKSSTSDEYRKQIYNMSLGPISSQTEDNVNTKINIIDNYINAAPTTPNTSGSNNSTNKLIDSDYIINKHSSSSDSDSEDIMFSMEM